MPHHITKKDEVLVDFIVESTWPITLEASPNRFEKEINFLNKIQNSTQMDLHLEKDEEHY